MALFIRNSDDRSKLQSKVAAELQERLKDRPPIRAEKVEPAFNDNQHQTRYAGIIIVVLLMVTIIVAAISVSR